MYSVYIRSGPEEGGVRVKKGATFFERDSPTRIFTIQFSVITRGGDSPSRLLDRTIEERSSVRTESCAREAVSPLRAVNSPPAVGPPRTCMS